MSDLRADDLGIVTGEAVALDVRPTGFILSAAGAAIDQVAQWLFFGGLYWLFAYLSGAFAGGQVDDALASAIAIILLVIAFVVAPVVVEVATRGRSLGRLAVGARIVRDDGGAISLRHAFIRALVGLLELTATFGGLAALVGLFNAKAKRLGDLLAGTVSQMERVAKVPVLAVGIPESLQEWSTRADVARMPDPLSRRIAAFLAQAPRLSPESRARLAASLAAEASPFVAPMPTTEPELLLAAIAAIRRDREFAALVLGQQRSERLLAGLDTNPHGFPDR